VGGKASTQRGGRFEVEGKIKKKKRLKGNLETPGKRVERGVLPEGGRATRDGLVLLGGSEKRGRVNGLDTPAYSFNRENGGKEKKEDGGGRMASARAHWGKVSSKVQSSGEEKKKKYLPITKAIGGVK